MILVCPLCRTRYLVQATLFTAGARQVRCARCKHSWQAEPPKEVEAVGAPPPEPTPIPESIAPIPDGSNLPVVTHKPMSSTMRHAFQAVAVLIGLMLLLWLILDRQYIGRRWTSTEPFYNAIGLYIYYPGDGLEFDQVRSEQKFDGGITKLIVSGEIKNKTKNNQKIPNIVAQALGSDGAIIQSWQIDAPKATLAPDEGVDFASSIDTPKGTVVNINLNFAEMKDDN